MVQGAMKTVGVAIVGFGTVGSGVARILLDSGDALAERAGVRLNLKYVCDADLGRPRNVAVPPQLFTDSLERVLGDPEVAAVCELVGGTTAAYDIVAKALLAGKDVVTANKALLAERGMDLLKLARQKGAAIGFEAAVAGSIPIILAIRDGLVANRITSIVGIVNGTCNYILTKMAREGASYRAALREAQAKGYAEAVPALDVSGGDSAHKLTILGRLAFRAPVRLQDVHCEGIDAVAPLDMRFGAELGYVLKLLAIGELDESRGVNLRVHPTFVPRANPLAHVDGPFNAVMVHGDASGPTVYYGTGAGQMPAASAVVSDLVDLALGRLQLTFAQRDLFSERPGPPICPIDHIASRYYLRFDVLDRPGVLGAIAGILGAQHISIASVLQHEPVSARHVPLIILTHRAVEKNVRNALAEIGHLPVVRAAPVCIRVLDQEGRR